MALLMPEDILRQVDTLYGAAYAAALATVQAKWAATEDIELADFEFRRIVADPENLEIVKLYPALLIAMGGIATVTGGGTMVQQYENFYEMEVGCVYFLRGQDTHQLGIILARHVEATLEFIGAYPRLGLRAPTTVNNIRFLPSSNVLPGGGNTLVKGVRVTFNVRFLQHGS